MAAQKTYFVLPGFIEEFKNSLGSDPNERIKFTLESYKVSGVEKLQNFPVSAGVLATNLAELDECNSDMSTCNLGGIDNSYNPFYNYLRFDFPLVNGVHRGQSTGTTNGIDYGFNDLNLTIDKEKIVDGFGNFREGSFAIDIDYDYDFYLRLNVQANPTTAANWFYGEQCVIEIKHHAETCTSSYKLSSTRTGVDNDVFFYGFLKGEIEQNESKDYHITPSCFDLIPVDVCEGYKTKSIGLLVRTPITLEPVAISQECCFKLPVFAEQGSKTENWKNDFKLLPVQKRQTENDTFTFKLLKCGEEIELNDDTLGTFVDFDTLEDYPDYTYFSLDWFEVLNNGNLGVGEYQFKVEYDISGVTGSFTSCIYDLNVYEDYRVDETVRIEAVMNGYLQDIDIDFTGLSLRDCMRVPGFFGLETPEREKVTLKMNNRLKNTIKITENREYSLETDPIERCATRHLKDWMFFADELYITDCNIFNHDLYRDFPVEPPKEVDPEYFGLSRKAIIRATFDNLYDNKRKLKCT